MTSKAKWHSKAYRFSPDKKYRAAKGGFVWFDESDLPERLRDVEYGPLFAYMFRRFGIPEYGSDDHKEIAVWYISTTHPGVALSVSPNPAGSVFSFGYAIQTDIFNNHRDKIQTAIVKKLLVEAVADLLVPVFVRDMAINAVGPVKDEDVADEVDPWEWAGHGVRPEYFEKHFNKGKQ